MEVRRGDSGNSGSRPVVRQRSRLRDRRRDAPVPAAGPVPSSPLARFELPSRAGEALALGRLLRRLGAWNGVVALAYHRIGDASTTVYDRQNYEATAVAFERQVVFLKKHFDVVGPNDLADVVARGRGRFVLITFDDGYADHFHVALPILVRHRLPATFFITTGFLDDRRVAWWDEICWMVRTSEVSVVPANRWLPRPLSLLPHDRGTAIRTLLRRYKELSGSETEAYLETLASALAVGRHPRDADVWMTWDEVRALHEAGMTIGGHTVNHPILARLPPDEQAQEIADCRARIEEEVGVAVRFFSYPNGARESFDEHSRAGLRAEGIELAFSYYGGYRRFRDWDPYDVRRRAVTRKGSFQRFAMEMTLPQIYPGG